jgi:hypothetical protein
MLKKILYKMLSAFKNCGQTGEYLDTKVTYFESSKTSAFTHSWKPISTSMIKKDLPGKQPSSALL